MWTSKATNSFKTFIFLLVVAGALLSPLILGLRLSQDWKGPLKSSGLFSLGGNGHQEIRADVLGVELINVIPQTEPNNPRRQFRKARDVYTTKFNIESTTGSITTTSDSSPDPTTSMESKPTTTTSASILQSSKEKNFMSSPMPPVGSKMNRTRTRRPGHGQQIIPFLGTLNSQESVLQGNKGSPIGNNNSSFRNRMATSSTFGTESAVSSGKWIRCICDTMECASNGENTCSVSPTGSCYSQLLERGDGSPPLIRGCISGATPLLCENRRPTSARWWPYLDCCNSDLCNAGGLTIPPTHLDSSSSSLSATVNHTNANKDDVAGDVLFAARDDRALADQKLDNLDDPNNRKSGDETRKFISPLAMSFLIGSAVIIIVVSAVGFYLLRREKRLQSAYYRKELTHEVEGDETPGGHANETCLSSPAETELSSSLEPNLIYLSFPHGYYRTLQVGRDLQQHPTPLDPSSPPQAVVVDNVTS